MINDKKKQDIKQNHMREKRNVTKINHPVNKRKTYKCND